uniref:Uncharacterized protein n=1 Tax=Amphimedon queenslandica TaxID=400682 RepID=A0A1X7U3G3_AMPQE
MSQRRVYPSNPSVPTGPSPGYHGNLPQQQQQQGQYPPPPPGGVANKLGAMSLGPPGPPSGSLMGAPPTSLMGSPPQPTVNGPPPSLMGAPPTSLISHSSAGPSSLMGPGPPGPSLMGPPPPLRPHPMGLMAPPTQLGGGPPTNIRPQPPPTQLAGPPPINRPQLVGPPPPTQLAGPPPTQLAAGPPPTQLAGHPPNIRPQAPPTHSQFPLHPSLAPPTSAAQGPPTGSHSHTLMSHTGTHGMYMAEGGGSTGMSMAGPPPLGHMTAPPPNKYPHSGPTGLTGSTLQPQPEPQPPPPQQVLPNIQPVNVQEVRNILPATPITVSTPLLPQHLRDLNPDPSVFCSTMSTVPATSGLLNKMKLPFAIHIHPFKDSKARECPVINPSTIVRCRVCRAYINPFVSFVDQKHWRCNFCFRNNIVPDNYDYNPQSGKSGDHSFHQELRHSSVEYIAPSEYMVRPPQPSVYFFVIDVTYPTIQSGLLDVFCATLLDCINKLPGDSRTMVGFLSFDHTLHFYNLKPSQAQPQMLVVSDLEAGEVFPARFPSYVCRSKKPSSALGPALAITEKLLHQIGGRITVLMSSLPNVGPGALKVKEATGATKMDQLNMSASTDFYKKLALDCSAQQIAVDLFVFSSKSQSIDLMTVSTVAKFSSGQVRYYQSFHSERASVREQFEKDFKRYLTRNIGFESVMRIRCTEGLSLHTFHGNFFVRSTDLLSLPNVNPDHAYCMNMAIDESLKDFPMVCFQAALLYTSYRGDRRIRVHTLCLPVSDQLAQLYAGLNVVPIAGVLAKMGSDRLTTASLGDARDALVNTVIDATKAYRSNVASTMQGGGAKLTLPVSLRLLPLFILSLLKNIAFTLSNRQNTDCRSATISTILTLPLDWLISFFYPKLYALHTLSDKDTVDSDGEELLAPPILQLSAEKLTRYGIFLMDYGTGIYIWVSKEAPADVINNIFGVPHFGAIPESMTSLPLLENNLNRLTNSLICQLRLSRQHFMPLLVIREDGPHRLLFINYLIDDKTEDGTSYYEFLSHISRQLTK